jgi:hypothetical protein
MKKLIELLKSLFKKEEAPVVQEIDDMELFKTKKPKRVKKQIKEYGGKEVYASKAAKAAHEKKEGKKVEMAEKKSVKTKKK